MDNARVTEAIEWMIERLEDTHPAYEIQVLLEPDQAVGVIALEAQVIHRESGMVARFRDSGSDIDGVIARLTRAVNEGLPPGSTEPVPPAAIAVVGVEPDPPQLLGTEEDTLDPKPVVKDD